MFMESKDGNNCAVYCSCGCQDGVLLSIEKDDAIGDTFYQLSFMSDNYYVAQKTGWARLKEKCKRIWKILRNKEHHYFDICIDGEDIQEFKEFIAKM